MDQDVAQQLADLRYQLSQLRSALGVSNPDAAETEVMALKRTVEALVAWGATVSPSFEPPAG